MFGKFFFKSAALFVLLFSGATQQTFSLEVETANSTFEHAFNLYQMKIKTFNMKQTVNLKVKYQWQNGPHRWLKPENMPDTLLVKNTIVQYFHDYQQDRDFWELINKNLVAHLKECFPLLKAVEIELEVLPGRTFPYLRSTIYKYENDQFEESFKFQYENPKNIQVLSDKSLNISYTYVNNIQPEDYLDFVFLVNSLDDFLSSNLDQISSWNTIEPMLIQHLLELYPMLKEIKISII